MFYIVDRVVITDVLKRCGNGIDQVFLLDDGGHMRTGLSSKKGNRACLSGYGHILKPSVTGCE